MANSEELLPAIAVRRPRPSNGSRMFVDYGVGGEPWHERHIVGVVRERDFVVITPDHDVYVETLDVPPLRNIRAGVSSRALPAGLGATQHQPVYRFSGAIPDDTMTEARALLAAERKQAREQQPPSAWDQVLEDEAKWVILDGPSEFAWGSVLPTDKKPDECQVIGDKALIQFGDALVVAKRCESDVRKLAKDIRDGWRAVCAADDADAGDDDSGGGADDGEDLRTLACK